MNMFSKIPIDKPQLNKFNLNHSRKFSCQAGQLIPVMVKEVLPGEKYRKQSHVMARFAPLRAPVMHDTLLYTEDYFVPFRLIWDEWEDFITGGRLGTSEPVVPYINIDADTLTKFVESSLADYLGLPTIEPTGFDTELPVNAFAFRAYQLIWNEYFRDQNLTADLDISKASGIVPVGAELDKITTLRNVCWGKDYLKSALPFSQRGAEVTVPIEVMVNHAVNEVGGADAAPGNVVIGSTGINNSNIYSGFSEIRLTGDEAGVSVNELREAFALQIWLEKNARGGARYKEQLLSHWGVVSSDARLQRPEFLGGGMQPMVISEVLQTVDQTESAEPGGALGKMGGHGVSVGSSNRYHRYFEEHGLVISVMYMRPRTGYQQGVPRHFRRSNKFDFAWRELANLGEQGILNSEVYYNGDATYSGDPNDVWGYIPRYAEYKYMQDTVHGAFRTSLSDWHWGEIFDTLPPLNESFVECVPPKRIFVVSDPTIEDVYVQIKHEIDALIPLPYFGVPSSMGVNRGQ